jgi:membrane-associated phospholipid phosphatase
VGRVTAPAETGAAPDAAASTTVTPPRHAWLKEAGIVVGFYYVYQTIRSLADYHGARARAYSNQRHLVAAEKFLHIYVEQSVQQAFLGARWFIRVMNIYYGTLHFAITIGLLIWLFSRRHDVYRSMRNLLGLTTALALIGYWAFPLAPPRLENCNTDVPVATPDGFVVGKCIDDTLASFGGLWSYHSPVAKAIANQYAAMPSLHFGWSLWCGIVLWHYGRRTGVRWMGVAYPVLTLFAIVVTGNHYLLDAVGGAVILFGARRLITWRQDRRSPATATEGATA